MEWISVKDRTPEEGVPVWVIESDYQGPIIMEYNYVVGEDHDFWAWCRVYDVPGYYKGKWHSDSAEHDDDYEVTHWMPLPEPPKCIDEKGNL